MTGLVVSGGAAPACNPTAYGCFPPCLTSVIGTPTGLDLVYTDGSTGSIALTCP